MRNKYPGVCYRCNQRVEVGEGHFERYHGTWRTQHADCAIKARAEKMQAQTVPNPLIEDATDELYLEQDDIREAEQVYNESRNRLGII